MTIKYGFELEGFLLDKGNSVVCPPLETLRNWSDYQDGFPGLIEIRTVGGSSLNEAYFDLMRRVMEFQEKISRYNLRFTWEHTESIFSGQQMAFLRKNYHFAKRQVDIKNLYGKEQRRLGNRTLASLQINISNETKKERTEVIYDKENRKVRDVTFPASSGLLDVGSIIRDLDLAFKVDIKASDRQPGMYALKDNFTRLEYRSLPNNVFENSNPTLVLKKIREAVEGLKI